uniref:Uncharacterized protein n=1 Tax=Brassica oleracea TaxID=3712 RepID=A0A3P6GMH6_BRAOL|nr:unnamed protein product [Brassica oleracea]
MFVIVYSPFVVMDIIKSARNIMALPSVAVLATELQFLHDPYNIASTGYQPWRT